MNGRRSCGQGARSILRYFSEKEVADTPGEHTFLNVPLSVDGVVTFTLEILGDEGRGVAECVADLYGRRGTCASS